MRRCERNNYADTKVSGEGGGGSGPGTGMQIPCSHGADPRAGQICGGLCLMGQTLHWNKVKMLLREQQQEQPVMN